MESGGPRYGAQAEGFLAAYPHANAEEATASAALIARDRYMASLVLWCQDRSAVDRAAICPYLYVHTYPGPEQARFGCFHASEVPYVFCVLDQGSRSFTQADREFAAELMGLGDLPGTTPGSWVPIHSAT